MQDLQYPTPRRVADREVPLCLIALLLTLIGQMPQAWLTALFLPLRLSSPGAYTVLLYAFSVFPGLVTLFFMSRYAPDRPLLNKLLPGEKNRPALLFWGLGAGLLLCLIAASGAMLSGSLRLVYGEPDPLWVVLCLPAVFLQSASEELVCRFFMFYHLRRGSSSPVLPVLVPSLLFAALHLANQGVTLLSTLTVFLAGLLFALCMVRYESFFLVAGLHTAWNFCQAVLLGLPNSGMPAVFGVFFGETDLTAPGFFFDPVFGLEGSAFAVILFGCACLLMLVSVIRRGKAAAPKEPGSASA